MKFRGSRTSGTCPSCLTSSCCGSCRCRGTQAAEHGRPWQRHTSLAHFPRVGGVLLLSLVKMSQALMMACFTRCAVFVVTPDDAPEEGSRAKEMAEAQQVGNIALAKSRGSAWGEVSRQSQSTKTRHAFSPVHGASSSSFSCCSHNLTTG